MTLFQILITACVAVMAVLLAAMCCTVSRLRKLLTAQADTLEYLDRNVSFQQGEIEGLIMQMPGIDGMIKATQAKEQEENKWSEVRPG